MLIYTRLIKCKGITLFPFIFLNSNLKMKQKSVRDRVINHERIHLQQCIEMLVLPFYLFYIIDYAVNRIIKGQEHRDAYRSLFAEREAFENDDNLEYLKTRKRYNWLKR